jgi:hypothetical protein
MHKSAREMHLCHVCRFCLSLLALIAAIGPLAGCRARALEVVRPPRPTAISVQFSDVTDAAHIRFTHHNAAAGKKMLPETTGSGCAFFDYDNDGWDDVLLIDSKSFAPEAPALALYHNNRDGTFTDVTATSGLNAKGFGMGCAIGDYDNDGFDDIFVSFIGPNHLYHNNHNGTFTDVTATAGVAGDPAVGYQGLLQWKWSVSCAFVDYDNDGKLDLVVVNYIQWSPQNDVFCGGSRMEKEYCTPEAYAGTPNLLYHNDGNGKFTDVSKKTRIADSIGKGWGVVPIDANGDGWTDLAVSNDMTANFLFINHGGKYFTEEAQQRGIALDANGKPKAGMGIDASDWQNGGRSSLLIGNFNTQKLSLWCDGGKGQYNDLSDAAGMAEPSINNVTWGLFFFDFDLDGWQDAFIANGHLATGVHDKNPSLTYEQKPLLFRNEMGRRFDEVAGIAGVPMMQEYVLRGCAWGDINNDGFPDMCVVANNNKPARLWKNSGGNGNHWVRLKLRGSKSNRSGIGAIITLKSGGVTQTKWVKSGGSLMSQCSLRPIFGLGKNEKVDEVQIRWPGGTIDHLKNLPIDKLSIISEGHSAPDPQIAGR